MVPKSFVSQLRPGMVLSTGEVVEEVHNGYFITVRLRNLDGVSRAFNWLDDEAVELAGFSNCIHSGLAVGHSPYVCTADSCI